MRLPALVLIVVVGALCAAHPASAYERSAELERVAAIFALRDAEVRCPSMDEWVRDPLWGGPGEARAWGYTQMFRDYVVLHPTLCEGARAVTDSAQPPWQRATGVLVLVHEAYHLRRWASRWNEGKVECEAIRHFTVAAQELGASTQLANDLLPYALAAHQRMITLYPQYRARRCVLPLWALPMSP